MKILVLNGSPKENSNTMILTTAFLNGLNENQEHSVKIVSVRDKNIQFCQGCLSCWFRQDGHCVMHDDMNELLDKMAASDMIVWSFPLYYHGIPAPLKALIDRTNPFLKIGIKMDGDKVVHEKVVDLSTKKNIVITGCGFPYYPDNFAPLKMQMNQILGVHTMICVYETTLLTIPVPTLKPMKDHLLTQFVKAGREFSNTGVISDITMQMLEKPMLPNEAYINMINNLKK